MKKQKTYTGINIQHPISKLILSGEKIIETRTYPIPPKYIDQEMLLVETPGKSGKFKSRVIAIIVFGDSFKYANKLAFYKDIDKHCVDKNSDWAWDDKKPKWGWPIKRVTQISPKTVQKRLGIKYTNNLLL